MHSIPSSLIATTAATLGFLPLAAAAAAAAASTAARTCSRSEEDSCTGSSRLPRLEGGRDWSWKTEGGGEIITTSSTFY